MANFNSARNDAYPANRKERRRFTMHSGIDEVFTGMLKKRSGRKKATETQELNDQQQEIISSAVSSDDDICKQTNSDLSDYQHIDQTQLISQKDSDMNSVNENTAQSTDTQYDELRQHASNFDNHVSNSDLMIKKMQPFKNVLESFKQVDQSHFQIEAIGHKKTYQMLQIAYKVAVYALEHRYEDFAFEARIRGIKITDNTVSNAFLPVVKTLWGQDGEKKVKIDGKEYPKWIHNRSCEKYAYVFRHLKENKVPPDEVASYIEGYKGGIKAIVEANSENCGISRTANNKAQYFAQKIIDSKSRPIGTFILNDKKVDEHLAYFIGKVSSDGTALIYEELKVSNGNFLASLKSAAGK